jgi:predicted restriction endonuclease
MADLSFVPRAADLDIKAEPKPVPDSGKRERKQHKLKRKAGVEIEAHADKLARVEFWRELRLAVWTRDHGKCRACGKPLDLEAGIATNALHCHHVRHRSQGGTDTLDNLASTCATDHRLHHDGRLTIAGDPNGTLFFTLRDLKGVVKRSWESKA